MILRVLTGRGPDPCVDEIYRRFEGLLTGPDRPDGLVAATLGRQSDGGLERFTCITQWLDMAALYAWIGCADLLRSPRVLAGLEGSVSDVDVQHFEVVASTEGDPNRDRRTNDPVGRRELETMEAARQAGRGGGGCGAAASAGIVRRGRGTPLAGGTA